MNEGTRQAVILAGGLGTRLRGVISDRPKPMAPIGSRPFLDYLVSRLATNHFGHIVICVSYMREKIEEYFGPKYGSLVSFVVEEEPLGTGGALRNAKAVLDQRFAVLNGDTYVQVDYGEMFRFHAANKAIMTIALARSDGDRFGRVLLDGDRIVGFSEKARKDGNPVNAGVYIVERSVLDQIPSGRAFSLEKELIPMLLSERQRVFGYATGSEFIDIGEPESYKRLVENPAFLER